MFELLILKIKIKIRIKTFSSSIRERKNYFYKKNLNLRKFFPFYNI